MSSKPHIGLAFKRLAEARDLNRLLAFMMSQRSDEGVDAHGILKGGRAGLPKLADEGGLPSWSQPQVRMEQSTYLTKSLRAVNMVKRVRRDAKDRAKDARDYGRSKGRS